MGQWWGSQGSGSREQELGLSRSLVEPVDGLVAVSGRVELVGHVAAGQLVAVGVDLGFDEGDHGGVVNQGEGGVVHYGHGDVVDDGGVDLGDDLSGGLNHALDHGDVEGGRGGGEDKGGGGVVEQGGGHEGLGGDE